MIILNIDMPKNCLECKLAIFDEDFNDTICPFTKVTCLNIGRQAECPIVCEYNDPVLNRLVGDNNG